MKKFKILAIGVITFYSNAQAQNENEALKYSQTVVSGTARAQGSAGAFGAVGGDFSSTVINPAGLGLYRTSEVLFSAAVTSNRADVTYFGNRSIDNRTNFNIPNWGGVSTQLFSKNGKDVTKGLVSLSFAVGMNRVNSYQANIQFNGINNQNTILDFFKHDANGLNANNIVREFNSNQNNYTNIPGAAAYYYFLLDTFNNLTTYRALSDGVAGAQFAQRQQMQIRGAANEYNFSSGANISHKVYLGAGFIVKHAHSQTNILFNEDSRGTVPNYTSSTLRQQINASGTGVGGRFGLIIRPIDWLKVGVAAQTPIRLNMRENYRFILNTTNYGQSRSHTPTRFDFINYQVISPTKVTLSAAATLKTLGFISVDYEMVDYAQMRMESNNFFFSDVNNTINNVMQAAGNLRIGTEVKIEDYYRLRAGFARYETPYKFTNGQDLNRYTISGGLGAIVDGVFIDFAVVNTFGNTLISPYTTGDSNNPDPKAVNRYSIFNFILSGGVRF